MAACEKYCEFSDEYPGHAMYDYKRNHIQIIPKHRKAFRGHKTTLHVFENGFHELYKWGGCSEANMLCVNPNPTDKDWNSGNYHAVCRKTPWKTTERWGTFFENFNDYKEELKKNKQRLLMEYAYVLEVPTVPGVVEGIYLNYSFDMKAVVRRLSRMVGKKNIKIVKHKGSVYEYLNKKENHRDSEEYTLYFEGLSEIPRSKEE